MNTFTKQLPDSAFGISVSLALQILKTLKGSNKNLAFPTVSEVTISKWTNPKNESLPSLMQLHSLLAHQNIELTEFLRLIDAIEKIQVMEQQTKP